MRDYIIMTDSCCDLSAAEAREMDVCVVSLSYIIDGKTYLNSLENPPMSSKAFFDLLREGKTCTTAAVNVGQFTDVMRPILEQGRDIIYVAFSSALSTTYQSACIAADDLKEDFPDAKIVVVDSLSASRGLGRLVYLAAQEKKNGKTIDEVADFVRDYIPRQCHWFTVDDLNHLKRGGRVSATTALVGTMLSIKPVLHVDDEGRLISREKARGMKAALGNLVDKVKELGVEPISSQTVFICHADCPDSVEYVKKLLAEKYGITDVRSDYIGPVIGAHTGAGTLGIFFEGSAR